MLLSENFCLQRLHTRTQCSAVHILLTMLLSHISDTSHNNMDDKNKDLFSMISIYRMKVWKFMMICNTRKLNKTEEEEIQSIFFDAEKLVEDFLPKETKNRQIRET